LRLTLDAVTPPGDLPGARLRIGGPMGWYAILAIVLFIAGIAAINRIEFGRFD
jgi:hypothetical protein